MAKRDCVLEALKELNIEYRLVEHQPVYTIDEMNELGICRQVDVCKNLFLRDDKGRKHFLVVLRNDKQANLKEIAEKIGSSKLGFASVERLDKFLGLEKGSVTPLGVINDRDSAVVVVLDSDLEHCEILGVHPNENNATVFMSYADLCSYIRHFGNSIISLKL